jgi:hypothetical protein
MNRTTNIVVKADVVENYKFTVKIDTKPYPINGGNSYSFTTSVELPNGNRIAKLGFVSFTNTSGICTYDVAKQGRGNILQRTIENPGTASFLEAFHAELVRACIEAGLEPPKPYISRDGADKDGKAYPDSVFTKINIDNTVDFLRALVQIRDNEDSPYEILLGEEDVDNATIKGYAGKCLKDSSIKELLNKIYGVKVTIDKSKKASVVFPEKLLNTKRLLEVTEFSDRIKGYNVVAYMAKFNNIFIKGPDSSCTFISSRLVCDKRESANLEADDEFDALVNGISCVKRAKPETEAAEEDPEDLFNMM